MGVGSGLGNGDVAGFGATLVPDLGVGDGEAEGDGVVSAV